MYPARGTLGPRHQTAMPEAARTKVIARDLDENRVFFRSSKFCSKHVDDTRPFVLLAARIGEVLDMASRPRRSRRAGSGIWNDATTAQILVQHLEPGPERTARAPQSRRRCSRASGRTGPRLVAKRGIEVACGERARTALGGFVRYQSAPLLSSGRKLPTQTKSSAISM